jgi:hypothetical protein
MTKYRFTLEPYCGADSRHECPECGQEQTFTRYIDTLTNEYISDDVGRCNRENKCGYHYTPKEFFSDTNTEPKKRITHDSRKEPKKRISFIPSGIIMKSLQDYEQNNFVDYLISLFGQKTTTELINRYFIGTSNHWEGATIFWQIDGQDRIRTGKIMLYNAETGKRVKKPYNHINWVHSLLQLKDFGLQQCFFGEHLIVGNDDPIAIVESEKTAIIASAYLPEFIWLATGSLSNISEEKFKVLKGRNIILYPDLGCFSKWENKVQEFSHKTNISISSLLEKNASEEDKKEGYDIADYLVRINYKKFEIETKL